MQPSELENLTRDALIERAGVLGVERASVLTRAELVDEIIRCSIPDPIERRIARGLLGLARDLLASVVERGLNLPGAAERIRNARLPEPWRPVRTPIATVTLAEIYAAQGHKSRALMVLDEVLVDEPEHTAARELRERIAGLDVTPAMPPEPEQEPEPAAQEEPGAHGVSLAPAEPPPAEPVAEDTWPADAVVVVPRADGSACVYWELRAATVAAEETEAPDGDLVVRLVAVTPAWIGPLVEARDILVTGRGGGAVVREVPARAALRAAVGWRVEERFDPLAVSVNGGPDLEAASRAQAWADGAGPEGSDWDSLAIWTP